MKWRGYYLFEAIWEQLAILTICPDVFSHFASVKGYANLEGGVILGSVLKYFKQYNYF